MLDVKIVPHLPHLLCRVAAQEQRVACHMQELPLEVVNHIDALIGGVGHCVNGTLEQFKVGIPLILNVVYRI